MQFRIEILKFRIFLGFSKFEKMLWFYKKCDLKKTHVSNIPLGFSSGPDNAFG